MAAARSSAPKSGHKVSTKQSSAYADSHSRKSDSLFSPPERMRRSTSASALLRREQLAEGFARRRMLGAPAGGGMGDGVARGIVEGDPQIEALTRCRAALGFGDFLAQACRAAGRGADDCEADTVVDEAVQLGLEIAAAAATSARSTSAGGRRQLSDENANKVSVATPRSGAASTTRRAASTPARCPAERGRPRRVAQRPLPSMMMATCSPLCQIFLFSRPAACHLVDLQYFAS